MVTHILHLIMAGIGWNTPVNRGIGECIVWTMRVVLELTTSLHVLLLRENWLLLALYVSLSCFSDEVLQHQI